MDMDNLSNETCANFMEFVSKGLKSSHTNMNSTNIRSLPFDLSNCTSFALYLTKLFENKRISDGKIFSIVYIAICLPLLLLQLTSLPIFLIHKNYRKNICFRILLMNGLVDSIQLGTVLLYAILNLCVPLIDPSIQKIGGALVIPIWSLVVIQHLLLALNRLIIIMRARYLGSKCIPDELLEKRLFTAALIVSWLLYAAILALFLSPYAGTLLDRGTMIFRFDDKLPYTRTYQAVNWYFTGWMPPLCFVIYLTIILTAKKSRAIQQQDSRELSASTGGVAKTKQPLLSDYERRLLIQAIILYSVMALLIPSWTFIDNCRIDYKRQFCWASVRGYKLFEISIELHSIAVEVPWIIYCGLSPILFLAMNKEFRARYLQLYTRKSADELTQMLTTVTFLGCAEDGERRRAKESRRKAVSHDPAGGNLKEKAKRKMTN